MAEGTPRRFPAVPETSRNYAFDPVNLLTPVVEVFLPLTITTNNTLLGLWFDTAGDTHVFIQQAVVPGNIYSQVKVISVRLPIAFGFTLFNLGVALWVTRSTILGMRAVADELAQVFEAMVEQVIEKLNDKAGLSQVDLQEIKPALPIPDITLDPVRLLAPVVEIFLPVTTANENTMLGLWFDTEGLLHLYVQQAVIPANIYSQVKITTIRLPVALGNA
ncbi:MAG TPA: hypothetical protein VNU93_08920, partial [Verrucomicrobiae bacterium]|nr:hypothetical protein [Verrucomicrobiae bacterium]